MSFCKIFCYGERIKFADIDELQVFGEVAANVQAMALGEIKIHDWEFLFTLFQQRENAGLNGMNDGKSIAFACRNIQIGIGASHFARFDVCPAHQSHFVVEKQISVRFPLADEQRYVVFLG